MADVELHNRPPAVTVRAGDRITLHLSENPSTGFRWSVAIRGEAVVVRCSEPRAADSGLPGAAGQRVIVLDAVHEGRATAEFALARSWEPDTPADTWQLESEVARPDPQAGPGDEID